MHILTTSELLQIWERSLGLHPLDRALTLLSMVDPSATWEQLAYLSIGQRDERLLALHEQMFGASLNSYAECPRCGERLEFNFDAHSLRQQDSQAEPGEIEMDGWRVRYRLPNSYDLAAIQGIREVHLARNRLMDRCLVEIAHEKRKATVVDLPTEIQAHVAQRLAQADPLANITLNMNCLACEHGWSISLDPCVFLWAEINNLAKRLLREVHTLARAYGWHESDILSMSAARRQAYLEMVTG